jgi:hypothetical protein
MILAAGITFRNDCSQQFSMSILLWLRADDDHGLLFNRAITNPNPSQFDVGHSMW